MQRFARGYIRSITKQYLTDSCTIEFEGTTRGGFGQNVTGWTPVATNLACRVINAGRADREQVVDFAGQEAIDDIKRLIVPHDTAIDVGQRVLIGGETYHVASLEVALTDEVFRAAVIIRKAGADG